MITSDKLMFFAALPPDERKGFAFPLATQQASGGSASHIGGGAARWDKKELMVSLRLTAHRAA